MSKRSDVARLATGVTNLDAVLGGGLPKGSVTIVSGPPGSGKTVLTQQICFHNASARSRVLYFNTLSEPTAKTLRYLAQFSFFDRKKLEDGVRFVDLGVMLRSKGLAGAAELVMQHIKKVKPAIVVIDSFKAFDDLSTSPEELRKFGYEMAVQLMAWQATALLLGEYGERESAENPLFSIIDGLITLSQRESSGENQRFLRVVKMRGTAHSRDEQTFVISEAGCQLFAPRIAIHRQAAAGPLERLKTGLPRLDELLGPGIPLGSSILLCGVAGTGKTVLSLEFVYRGALAGEKGILFSFEETEERLRATARALGWDLDHEIERGMIQLVFIPQPDIMVESDLLMIRERVEAMNARRVVLDSVSVFLHKIKDAQVCREKVFHLSSIIQNAQAVGLFTTDIPYGARQISRFGVEETVVDGVIVLSSTEEGMERQRYIEIYKLRNTAHLKGRHYLIIGPGGVSIFPRYGDEPTPEMPPPPVVIESRLGSGVPGLDRLIGGGLLERSVTLLSGSAGAGKTTFGAQFIMEGVRRDEPGLFVTLEEGPAQLLASTKGLGIPLGDAVSDGRAEILYLARQRIRAGQFLTVLSDRIRAMSARRVVLDAVSQMFGEETGPDEFRRQLYGLAVRFKTLGVTTILTFEASSLESPESLIEGHLSPAADNLVLLRYTTEKDRLEPTLTVVKTRGSPHDRGCHRITVGPGGLRVGSPGDGSPRATARRGKGRGKRRS
jgi:circadian clock protein KaiC